MSSHTMFSDYLTRWTLTTDGAPVMTPTSGLLPVLWGEVPAMLKVAIERAGNQLMVRWNGEGAARTLAHDENAILMERGETGVSLADMARDGRDDEASRIMCGVLRRLHAVKLQPRPALPDLAKWFEPLDRAAEVEGGIWRAAARWLAIVAEAANLQPHRLLSWCSPGPDYRRLSASRITCRRITHL